MNCRLIFAFIFVLTAAAGPGALRADETVTAKDNPPATRLDYTLQASDLIKVQVFQELDLDREVRLSQEYTVTLPLIGTVNLKGKTVRQACELIQDLYNRHYLVNPQVTIMVMEFASRTVNVLGADDAGRGKVKLTRVQPGGRAEMQVIDADDIIQGRSQDAWLLQKDDVIYVPERIF